MAGGVNVPIGSTWNPAGIRKASNDLGRFEKQAKGFSSGMTKSFMGLGASIGGALAFGAITNQMKAMAEAAAQDQLTVVALGKAMSNLGIGSQTAAMEDYVKATMLATGTSDELIRQGLTKLTTATGDAAKAQQLLNLALDISAAGYGDVVAISTALSKAATGNATALKRLGVPLDEAAVKAKDLDAIFADLSNRFRGQASAAAATYAGQIKRLDTAIAEAQETIGYALLGALDDVSKALGGTGGFIEGVTDSSEQVGYLITGVGELSALLTELGARTSGDGASWVDWLRSAGDELAQSVIPQYEQFKGVLEGVLAVGKVSTLQEEERARQAQVTADRYTGYANALRGVTEETEDGTEAYRKQKSAVDRLKASLDAMNGKNRSVLQNRIALRRLKAEGPDKSGERKVRGPDGKVTTKQFTTRDDRLTFGLDLAEQTESLATALADKGKTAAARRTLSQGNDTLAGMFGQKFADANLSVPAWLDRGDKSQRTWGDRAAGTTNNYYFGDIYAKDAADAAEQARKAARLKALSGRQSVAAHAAYGGYNG